MWLSKEKLEEMLSGGESVLQLKKQIRELKDELATLQTTKKMEQREIEHLVKLKEEKLNIDFQKKELKLKDEFGDKMTGLQSEYHKLTIDNLDKARQEMKEIYTQIMERLPNITASLEVTRGNRRKK